MAKQPRGTGKVRRPFKVHGATPPRPPPVAPGKGRAPARPPGASESAPQRKARPSEQASASAANRERDASRAVGGITLSSEPASTGNPQRGRASAAERKTELGVAEATRVGGSERLTTGKSSACSDVASHTDMASQLQAAWEEGRRAGLKEAEGSFHERMWDVARTQIGPVIKNEIAAGIKARLAVELERATISLRQSLAAELREGLEQEIRSEVLDSVRSEIAAGKRAQSEASLLRQRLDDLSAQLVEARAAADDGAREPVQQDEGNGSPLPQDLEVERLRTTLRNRDVEIDRLSKALQGGRSTSTGDSGGSTKTTPQAIASGTEPIDPRGGDWSAGVSDVREEKLSAALEVAPDPTLWQQAVDERGFVYYWNMATMETSWTAPPGFDPSASAAAAARAQEAAEAQNRATREAEAAQAAIQQAAAARSRAAWLARQSRLQAQARAYSAARTRQAGRFGLQQHVTTKEGTVIAPSNVWLASSQPLDTSVRQSGGGASTAGRGVGRVRLTSPPHGRQDTAPQAGSRDVSRSSVRSSGGHRRRALHRRNRDDPRREEDPIATPPVVSAPASARSSKGQPHGPRRGRSRGRSRETSTSLRHE